MEVDGLEKKQQAFIHQLYFGRKQIFYGFSIFQFYLFEYFIFLFIFVQYEKALTQLSNSAPGGLCQIFMSWLRNVQVCDCALPPRAAAQSLEQDALSNFSVKALTQLSKSAPGGLCQIFMSWLRNVQVCL